MISYIIPTHDRPEQLSQTLEGIARLGDHGALGGAEVIVVDNASNPAAWTPDWLRSGIPVKLVRRERNEAAAGRNAGARAASEESTWLVMLDDDSHPMESSGLAALTDVPGDVGAISAEIFLPSGARESGGLPEVFVGCGVAIRRDAFLRLGGYDATFDYYAEEYDLAARMIAAGYRITFDRSFRVLHRKTTLGRDFGRILRRLVRNNGWIAQRYAPAQQRAAELRETVLRYGRIAWKERSLGGYLRGAFELASTLGRQSRRPLREDQWDRLTGLHHARVALAAADATQPLGRVAIVEAGKNGWAVERALVEAGATIVSDARSARTLVIGTMSPGPMLDALERAQAQGGGQRVVAPWVEAMRAAPVLVNGHAEIKRIDHAGDEGGRARLRATSSAA
jgi:GT2 family glycosyltransferase